MSNSDNPIDYQQIIDDSALLASNAFRYTKSYIEIFRCDDQSEYVKKLNLLLIRNIAMVAYYYPEGLHYSYELPPNTNPSHPASKEGSADQLSTSDEVMALSKIQMKCFFMLIPNHLHFSFCQKLSFGLLWLPYEIGWTSFQRLLAAAEYYENAMKECMIGYEKYYELQRMVVHPSTQGQGVGSYYLGKALREIADKEGVAVVLGTQDTRNLVFYGKL